MQHFKYMQLVYIGSAGTLALPGIMVVLLIGGVATHLIIGQRNQLSFVRVSCLCIK